MKRLSLFAAIFCFAVTLNATVYNFAGITADQITAAGTIGKSTLGSDSVPSVSAVAGTDVNISISGMADMTINYTNSGAKADFFRFGPNFMYVAGKNAILTFNNVTVGDEIKLTVAAKGSTDAVFHAQAGASDADQSVTKIDDVANFATVTFTATATTVQIKETAGGFNIVKAVVGSEAPATKTVFSVEKKWSIVAPGVNAARQGFGLEGALYYHKSGDGVYKVASATATPEMLIADSITGIGAHAIAKDDAGNIVLFGSASFPTSATSENFIYILQKGQTVGTKIASPILEGFNRTDFIAASGDVFSAEGGHLYILINAGTAAYDVTIQNGQASATKFNGMTMAGQQNCMMLKEGAKYYYVSASQGIYEYDGTTSTLITGLTDLSTQCVGATKFMLGGKEIFVYHVGTNYSPEFKVFNKTDGEFLQDANGATVFYPNDVTKIASYGALRGVWANAEKVDDNNYMLYIWHAGDGGAVYQISAVNAAEVTLACDTTMGTVAGAGDIAVGANATVVATPKVGYEFVAWKKGETVVSNNASYTFAVTENVALTAVFEAKDNVTITLAVNDATKGTITLPEGFVMGANSVVYGTAVELTAVPGNDMAFLGWYKDADLYSSEYTITLNGKETISLTAKFVNILHMSYELNGGVTNDSAWTSKGAIMLEIQNDYNARYNSTLSVVKEQNGVYYFFINGKWVTEAQAQGNSALVTGFFQNKTWSADQKCANLFLNNPKYQFLVDLIDHFRGSANAARGTDSIKNMAISTADAYFRADVSGFMLNSPATEGYPYTCNWAVNGIPEAFIPAWKHAFANPTQVVTEFTLNTPYKEGFTFDGWYANADFSGNKVTTVSPESNIPGNKLYAKWIEYVMTIAEAIATDSNSVVKTAGVVNFINGKQVYIQDASGAVLVYMKAAPSCQVGDYIVVTGNNVIYNAAPEIANGVITSTEAGHPMPAEITATLGALKADMLKYFAKRIAVEGLVIASYDTQKNPYVTDGVDTVELYKVVLDQTTFPVGARVNIHLIGASYKGAFQFVGPASGVELAPLSGKDNYVYPARGENGEYTLTNKWLICDKLDNYSANRPAGTNFCRGMAAKDGKMYFVNREIGGFTVVDGATGTMLEPIIVTGEHLFQAQDSTGEWKDAVTLKFNDVKFDNAGNCLIAACATTSQRVMVYVVDLATGAATELINERLYDNEDFATDSWRMDAIGVYGDVKNRAIVMFGNSMNKDLHAAYMWEINDGVAGEAERIDLVVTEADDTYLWKGPNELYTENSSACQVFPVDFNYFYWDHHSCRPTLFSTDGTFADDLKACPTGVTVVNNAGDTCLVGSGHNGICEFQIGEEYFVIMAATNNVETPSGAYALYKFADAAKSFDGLTPLWYFPAGGMGGQQNAYRTAVPSVEVNGNVATIYLYTGENGYGVYEMTGVATGFNNVEGNVETLKVVENGQVYIIRNGVRYTVLGAVVR